MEAKVGVHYKYGTLQNSYSQQYGQKLLHTELKVQGRVCRGLLSNTQSKHRVATDAFWRTFQHDRKISPC